MAQGMKNEWTVPYNRKLLQWSIPCPCHGICPTSDRNFLPRTDTKQSDWLTISQRKKAKKKKERKEKRKKNKRLEIVKIVNFMLYIFYHNKKEKEARHK